MIVKILPSPSTRYDLCAMATKIEAPLISVPVQGYEREFCYCCYECNACNSLVFGGSTNPINNDKTSVLFKKQLLADTITIKLMKDGVQVALLNSNALGQYFTGIGANGLYDGYLLDWNLVYNAHGIGNYTIETDYTIVGISGSYSTSTYNLMPYSEELADQTIKIEWWQNGNIESSAIDFTGLNWYQSVRLQGSILTLAPDFIEEQYQTTDRRTTQIQASVVQKWRIETEMICKELKDLIICDLVLANDIKITNFNLFQELIVQQSVNIESIETLKIFQGNRNFALALNVEDRYKNKLKRNC